MIRTLLLLTTLLLAGCGSSAVKPAASDLTVELDAFSGQPNPVWSLSAAEADALAARLRAATPADPTPATQPTLGFRGFRIEDPGRAGGFGDVVDVARGGHVMKLDADGGLVPLGVVAPEAEAWLLDLARDRGFGQVVEG